MEHNKSEKVTTTVSQDQNKNESVLQNPTTQTIIVKHEEKKSNGFGTAGFVLSIIAIFVGWVPVVGWVVWLLGLIFSFIGIFKSPKGMAIAGLVISLIGIIFIIFVFGAFLASAAL